MKSVRSWYIDASGPAEGLHKWRKRIQISVLAESAQHALTCFRGAYPDAEVWCIRHEGKRLVLDGFTIAPDDTQ